MYTPPPPPQPPYVPPPPPPPPGGSLPPPRPPYTPPASFDFGRPFAFVFEDREWLKKILMGGLFAIGIVFFLLGLFPLMGYMARVMRNTIEGRDTPLPEWDDIGDMFSEGVRLFGVALCWMLPFVLLVIVIFIPSMFMMSAHNDAMQGIGGLMIGGSYCLWIPLNLALRFIIPVAMLRAVVQRRFGAGIEVGAVIAMIKANFVNFLMAFLVSFIASLIAGFGIVACIVGVFFTSFWSMLVTAQAYGQAYRLSPVK